VPQLLSRGLAGLMCAQALLRLIFSDQYGDSEPIRTKWFGNGLASAPGELPIRGPLTIVTTTIALVLLTNLRRERVVLP
jgi:hypothetical protein